MKYEPKTHARLFQVADSATLTDFNKFADTSNSIFGLDAFLGELDATGLLNTVVSDAAPTDLSAIWIDPNNPATDAASVVKMHDGDGWVTGTWELFAATISGSTVFPTIAAAQTAIVAGTLKPGKTAFIDGFHAAGDGGRQQIIALPVGGATSALVDPAFNRVGRTLSAFTLVQLGIQPGVDMTTSVRQYNSTKLEEIFTRCFEKEISVQDLTPQIVESLGVIARSLTDLRDTAAETTFTPIKRGKGFAVNRFYAPATELGGMGTTHPLEIRPAANTVLRQLDITLLRLYGGTNANHTLYYGKESAGGTLHTPVFNIGTIENKNPGIHCFRLNTGDNSPAHDHSDANGYQALIVGGSLNCNQCIVADTATASAGMLRTNRAGFNEFEINVGRWELKGKFGSTAIGLRLLNESTVTSPHGVKMGHTYFEDPTAECLLIEGVESIEANFVGVWDISKPASADYVRIITGPGGVAPVGVSIKQYFRHTINVDVSGVQTSVLGTHYDISGDGVRSLSLQRVDAGGGTAKVNAFNMTGEITQSPTCELANESVNFSYSGYHKRRTNLSHTRRTEKDRGPSARILANELTPIPTETTHEDFYVNNGAPTINTLADNTIDILPPVYRDGQRLTLSPIGFNSQHTFRLNLGALYGGTAGQYVTIAPGRCIELVGHVGQGWKWPVGVVDP